MILAALFIFLVGSRERENRRVSRPDLGRTALRRKMAKKPALPRAATHWQPSAPRPLFEFRKLFAPELFYTAFKAQSMNRPSRPLTRAFKSGRETGFCTPTPGSVMPGFRTLMPAGVGDSKSTPIRSFLHNFFNPRCPDECAPTGSAHIRNLEF